MTYTYSCIDCGWNVPNDKNRSDYDWTCPECLGSLAPWGGQHSLKPGENFEKGYCPTLKKEVYSWKQQEREARKFRSKDHPKGFVFTQDNKKFLKKLKDVRNNKPDFIKQELAKSAEGRAVLASNPRAYR